MQQCSSHNSSTLIQEEEEEEEEGFSCLTTDRAMEFCGNNDDIFQEMLPCDFSISGHLTGAGEASNDNLSSYYDEATFNSSPYVFPEPIDCSRIAALLDEPDPEPSFERVDYSLPPPQLPMSSGGPASVSIELPDPFENIMAMNNIINGYPYASSSTASLAEGPSMVQNLPMPPLAFEDNHHLSSFSGGYLGFDRLPPPPCSFMDNGMGMFFQGNMGLPTTAADSVFPGSMPMANGGMLPPLPDFKEYNPECNEIELFGPEATVVQAVFPSEEIQSASDMASEVPSMDESPYKARRLTVEERKEKILRYIKKRDQRNFSKKIKYACRKTLADSRPRVRGRFAKNDEFGDVGRSGCGGLDDGDEDVGIKGSMMESCDIFAHLNNFKCNYTLDSLI